MATGTMATAAGAAVLLCYVLKRTLASKGEDDAGDRAAGDPSRSGRPSKRRIARRQPAQAPATLFEAIATLAETLRFTYSETLGKWPIGDLAFGIKYLMRRQGNISVASIYAGSNCIQLGGPEILAKLLKPAFTVIRDKSEKCLLLLIRGTHSIKDTLTAATGAVVPFHHSVLCDGGISNLVLGYAHCGMVAAARWIAKLSTPYLLKALDEHPDYKIKVVGHSLGGGTAALLTYILREQKEFSSTTCVTFAPAACMTWELAESGKDFVTTTVNGSDLVPTFSAVSIDDLRSEVTASSWLNDLRDQVERTRVLNVVYRSATAIGSRLPSMASAKARVVGAGALLHPVSSGTQGVMKRAQNVAQAVVRTRSSISSWSCMGARRRNLGSISNSKVEDQPETTLILDKACESHLTEATTIEPVQSHKELHTSDGSGIDSTDEEEELIPGERDISEEAENITEGELWDELEKELQRQEKEPNIQAQEEEAAAAKEITKEENEIADASESQKSGTSLDSLESHRFYPPGRIMHMVSLPTSDDADMDHDGSREEHVGIYETPRELYSKIRLSRTMINDHYMPMYKRMMELLIRELENAEVHCEI
ncbi:hypothetical protein ACJRO7_032465 [Eucalyptus globulus]|uniref:Uncharacterized protein n=1 Tax=Eucalyptus globulus TaxID=34317 RepID=A0ABD3JKX3_EUCGL